MYVQEGAARSSQGRLRDLLDISGVNHLFHTESESLRGSVEIDAIICEEGVCPSFLVFIPDVHENLLHIQNASAVFSQVNENFLLLFHR